MIILKLHTIGEGIEGISPTYGAYMAECAAVCFESQGHKSGVLLPYSDGQVTKYSVVEWTHEVNDSIMDSHFDEKRTTDFGAMGVAVLLTCELTDFRIFKTSETNNGYDFLLRNKSVDENFLSGKLEISGIRKETPQNTVKSRLSVKEKQILKNIDDDAICYVSIIEFSKPEAKFIKQ